MPTDAEVIAKAREFSELGDFGENISQTLEQLADIAEKRGAMAVEERAKILYDSHGYAHFNPLGYKSEISNASKELDLESTSWRKIGPEEIEYLDFIHRHIEKNVIGNIGDDDLNRKWICANAVLRRMISEKK
jgi:hypothetical protein